MSLTPLEISARHLADRLRPLTFSALSYLPLDYAWEPHATYLRKFGQGKKRIVFLGMNPGPYGMAQTGVPFGEVTAVRDWMGISAEVGKPPTEHPKRPIQGFACPKSEVSGRRLWGLFSERFPKAEDFFADHFVLNFCPLIWMSPTGANLTPDKLPAAEMQPADEACLDHLAENLAELQPEWLIGVGAYAEEKLRLAAERIGSKARLGRVLHPSPASPAANRGWAEAATKQLLTQGVWES
jgi:single-strand selective monofunctional uracil DNA glycosylase